MNKVMSKIILLFFTTSFLFYSFCCFYSTHHSSIRKWENNYVYFTYKRGFSNLDKITIEMAMEEWEKVCNIQFIPIKKGFYYSNNCLVIKRNKKKTNWNYATLGRGAINSSMTLSSFDRGVILHELGHVLGLQHEHCRPDRDEYIKVLYENIDIKHKDNFDIAKDSDFLYPYHMYSYDYKSVMHYSEFTFSKNKKKTIVTNNKIGLDVLSEIDIQKVQYIYGRKINE